MKFFHYVCIDANEIQEIGLAEAWSSSKKVRMEIEWCYWNLIKSSSLFQFDSTIKFLQ